MRELSVTVLIAVYPILLIKHPAFAFECIVPNSKFVNNVCYIYYPVKMDWTAAKKMCLSQGLNLARLESSDQIRAALTPVQFLNKQNLSVEDGVWIGANDRLLEGLWVWDDNIKQVAMNSLWMNGEPDDSNGSEDCGLVDSLYFLRDGNCSLHLGTLCMETQPSYFGFQDEFECHCQKGNCDIDGQCQDASSRCQFQWFGELCQFRDLLLTESASNLKLADNDDTTCEVSNGNRETLKLRKPSHFTWMRVVVKNEAELHSFEVSLVSNNTNHTCVRQREIIIDDLTMDILCFTGTKLIDSIVLSWKGDKTICSVHINGGQNVALRQRTTQSGEEKMLSELAVDGDEGILSPCTRLLSNSPHIWELTFNRPQIVYDISIYRKRDVRSYTNMDGFVLQLLTADNIVSFTYTDKNNGNKMAVEIFTMTLVPVVQVKVILKTGSQLAYLEICEIKIYGECAPPFYGIFCDLECSKECKNRYCNFNGDCYECSEGAWGNDCREGKRVHDNVTTTAASDTTTTDILNIEELTAINIVLAFLVGLFLAFCIAGTFFMWLQHKTTPKEDQEDSESSDTDVTNVTVPVVESSRNTSLDPSMTTISEPTFDTATTDGRPTLKKKSILKFSSNTKM